MPIQSKGRKEDNYIQAVPERRKKAKRVQISLTLPPTTLAELNALAQRLGQPRAALINFMIRQGLDRGISL